MQESNQTKNLSIYEQVRTVPENALRKIEAGRLKGKSDINPMWRIKVLTENFGPVGQGWYTEITNKWSETSENGEVAVFVDLNLYVRYPDGEWSKPVLRRGGSYTYAAGGAPVKLTWTWTPPLGTSVIIR